MPRPLLLRGGRGSATGSTGCGHTCFMPPMVMVMGGEWEEGSVAYMCAAAVEADQVPCLGGSGWGWRMGSGCCTAFN